MAQFVIDVPDALGARVGAALRAAYPDITSGQQTDGQVARTVFGWLIANLLAQYEAEKVRAVKTKAIKDAQDDLTASVEAAREAAWQAIGAVVPTAPTPAAPAAGADTDPAEGTS